MLLSVFATGIFCSPVIVKEVLHGDAGQFGGELTAFGIGGLFGPLLILATMRRVNALTLSLAAAATYSVCVIAAGWVNTVAELAAVLVASGFLLTVANTSANTFLQSNADNRNRGQVASLFMLAMRGGMSIGNLITGTTMALSNVTVVFAVNGTIALACQLCVLYRWRHSEQYARALSRSHQAD